MSFGGGGSGGGQIATSTDVALNNPATGQVLTYNFTLGKWQNQAIPSAPVSSVNSQVGAVVLAKADVGLGNVDNTSDINKPISTATQAALDAKQNSLGYTAENQGNKSTVTTLGTSDTLYPSQNAVKTYVDTAASSKEPAVTAGTTAQYYRGDKTWQTLNQAAVGLANVDNTSDVNKPISTATQTALNAKADSTSVGAKVIVLGPSDPIPSGTPAGTVVVRTTS